MSARGFFELAALARSALARGERAALAHLVRVTGSHYRRPGARAVLTESGESAGAISAGCLESDLAARIPVLHRGGAAVFVEYELTADDDSAWGLGLGCGGRLTIRLAPIDEPAARDLQRIAESLSEGRAVRVETEMPGGDTHVEEIEPGLSLLVCGTGPDAAALARQALLLGWSVTAAATRMGGAAQRRFEELGVPVASPGDIPRIAGRPRTAAIVMTHGFLDDLEMLVRLAGVPLVYRGVLGPRARTRRLLDALPGAANPVDAVARGLLHAPAGLDVGAETPEEIALAIAAEIQAVAAGRGGGSLRNRTGPIHSESATPAGALSADCR